MLLDFDSIANVRQLIWDLSKELLDTRRTGRWHQNTRACFGLGRCPYFELCNSKDNPLVLENLYCREAPHSELSASDEETSVF